jgi:hypothetical protein
MKMVQNACQGTNVAIAYFLTAAKSTGPGSRSVKVFQARMQCVRFVG